MSENNLLALAAELLIDSLADDGFDTMPGDVDIICDQFRLIGLTSLDGAYGYFAEQLDALKRRILGARGHIRADAMSSVSDSSSSDAGGFALSSTDGSSDVCCASSISGASSSTDSSSGAEFSLNKELAQSLKDMGFTEPEINEALRRGFKCVEDASSFIFNSFGDNAKTGGDNLVELFNQDKDAFISKAAVVFNTSKTDVEIALEVNSCDFEGFALAVLEGEYACESCQTRALDFGSYECIGCKKLICSMCVERTKKSCPFCRKGR